MSTREDELTQTLRHVAKWLSGDGGLDLFKDVPARTANRIIAIIVEVDNGKTLKQAIDNTGGEGAF